MSNIFLIPLSAPPQIFTAVLGGTTYTLTVQYRNTAGGGWVLDLGDVNNNPVLTGLPLVTGANLLAQYAYLGLGGGLYVQTTDDPDAVPTFTNLGTDALLYWVTAA